MKPLPLRPLTVAGIMGGTSGDGLDVAVVRIAPRRNDGSLTLRLRAHYAAPFAPALRRAVLAAQDAQRTTTAELARLHWRLGLAYAEALTAALRQAAPIRLDLVGCHGQTIYHQGAKEKWLGRSFRCTWQIGEMAPLAAAAGVPVVSNLRAADMAAGGQGAPLVPLLDVLLYRHRARTRILQNIGGIANLTVVPPLGSSDTVVACDTGPGNMVIDALMQQLYARSYDSNGATAARGRVVEAALAALLRNPFFALPPPRSAGREQFGPAFAAALLRRCRALKATDADIIATATALTARSIAAAAQSCATAQGAHGPAELIVAGGGAKNATLLHMLRASLPKQRFCVLTSSDRRLPTRIPVEAKEAAAFALLAYMSWHRLPGNIPAATGADRPVVLGQVSCA